MTSTNADDATYAFVEMFDKVIRFAWHARENQAKSRFAFINKLEVFGVGRLSWHDFNIWS